MLKRLIFCLWILLPFSLFAQNEEESSTAHDSLSTEKHQGAFMKAIKKFLNFNDFDTTYISPNRYNYALMLDHFTNYEYYSVGTAAPEPQRLRFTPNPRNKIGAYFGWRWIFLGWSVDTDGLLGKKSKYPHREYAASLRPHERHDLDTSNTRLVAPKGTVDRTDSRNNETCTSGGEPAHTGIYTFSRRVERTGKRCCRHSRCRRQIQCRATTAGRSLKQKK